jgi:hypothetical protein
MSNNFMKNYRINFIGAMILIDLNMDVARAHGLL